MSAGFILLSISHHSASSITSNNQTSNIFESNSSNSKPPSTCSSLLLPSWLRPLSHSQLLRTLWNVRPQSAPELLRQLSAVLLMCSALPILTAQTVRFVMTSEGCQTRFHRARLTHSVAPNPPTSQDEVIADCAAIGQEARCCLLPIVSKLSAVKL